MPGIAGDRVMWNLGGGVCQAFPVSPSFYLIPSPTMTTSTSRHPHPPVLNPLEPIAVHLYVDEGLSTKEIGERLGRSGERIRQLLTRAGVTRRSGSVAGKIAVQHGRLPQCLPVLPVEAQREIAQVAVEQDLSTTDLGEQFGLSGKTIGDYLRAHDVRRGTGYVPAKQREAARRQRQGQRHSAAVRRKMSKSRRAWWASLTAEQRAAKVGRATTPAEDREIAAQFLVHHDAARIAREWGRPLNGVYRVLHRQDVVLGRRRSPKRDRARAQ